MTDDNRNDEVPELSLAAQQKRKAEDSPDSTSTFEKQERPAGITQTVNEKIKGGVVISRNEAEQEKASDFDSHEEAPTIQLSRKEVTSISPKAQFMDELEESPGAKPESLAELIEKEAAAAQAQAPPPAPAQPKPTQPPTPAAPTPQPSQQAPAGPQQAVRDASHESDEPEAEERRLLKISCHRCLQKLDVTYLEPFSHFECPSCNTDLIVPRWFDNYLLEEPGGLGGMATVYRALDLALDREVAIKVLNPEVASEKERGELFLHEARTAATINHYAVIPIYTCGEFDDQPYIVMQYMAGGSLEDRLRTDGVKGLPVNDVVRWIRDVCEGLDNAHRHGIIHHDIKPGNIMLDNEGNAKIGDFGIAQAVNDTRNQQIFEITKSWISPHYVSPEKIIEGSEDQRGDIYSLGATFYNLITGTTPFEHEDLDALIRLRLTKDPEPPHKIKEDIPGDISGVIMAMMQRDPDKRPSYREIVKLLSNSLKGQGQRKQKKAVIKTSVNQQKLDSVFDRRTKRKRPLLTWGIFLFIWIIILGAGYYAHSTGLLQSFWKMINKGSATDELPKDLLPELTQASAEGRAKDAQRLAQQAFEQVDADLATREQAAVVWAISSYLLREKDATQTCSEIADRLKAAQDSASGDELVIDPHYAIIFYLSGSKRVTASDITEDLLTDTPYLLPTARLAVFLRDLYEDKSSEQLTKSYSSYYSSAKNTGDFWGNAWKPRLEEWTDCLQNAVGDPKTLEPIFVPRIQTTRVRPKPQAPAKPQPDNSQPITDVNAPRLTEDYLANERPFVRARPRPADYSFAADKKSEYLKSVPAEHRDAETTRWDVMASIKMGLCQKMGRATYRGEIVLKKGEKLKDAAARAQMAGLSIRTRSGKRMRIGWNQLAPEQVGEFIKYYADQSIKDGNTNQATKSYIELAVFQDWYELYKEAVATAQQAVAIEPASKPEVDSYLLK